MFKKDFKKSVRYKFLKDISIILFISTCVLSSVIALNVGTTLENALTSKGLSFATNIAKRNENALIMNGSTQMSTVYSELITDEEIIYTIIEDNNGKILTTQFESVNFKWPGLKEILPMLSRDSELSDIIATIKKQVAVKEISVPIMIGKDTMGRVSIGMSEHNINKQILKTALFVITLNLLVAVVLGWVLFIASKKTILDPIIALGHAAARIAKGDLSSHVTVKTIGELQMLVDGFNQMIADLKKTTVSRDYVDNIIASMLDTLIVVSPEGTIMRLNAAACALLGYAEAELIGRPVGTIIAMEQGGAAEILSMLDVEVIGTSERTYRARDMRKIPVLFSASIMHDDNGGVQGIVCVAQDITERKQAEEKLKNYSEDLGEINEELKNFAYIVSHDLRAPLVNIKGFSEELKRSLREIELFFEKHHLELGDVEKKSIIPLLQRDIPEALAFIGSSVTRMDNLISSILKLSRAGRRKLNPELLETQEFVRGILDTLAHQIESGNITVTVGNLPCLVADRTAMEQIFGNLLDNAVKYLEPGRPGEIAVSAERSYGENIFHVRDNGRGITKEDIPRAFEIFRRVGRQDVPGEGMGLPYVKTIIRNLGGRIWCESQPGAGTTFSFTIPTMVGQSVEPGTPGGLP
jgi:PAS domain S-box-containing protein